MDDANAQVALISQLQAKGAQSKKYRMVVMGLIGVLFIFLVSVGTMIFKTELAASVTSLASIVVASLGGLVAVGIGSQAAVDWNTTSSLSKK